MQTLKNVMENEYKIKDLDEIKIIIQWQITRDTAICMMKIDQSTFIKNLVINEGLEKSNANIIPMKASSVIEMLNFGD